MEKHNRRSHLAPQLSPATQELLKPSDSPTYHGGWEDRRGLETPTSGEIPIAGAVITTMDKYATGETSPTRNGMGSIGRPGGSSFHPGLGQRVQTPNTAIPHVGGGATFSLPVRPAPGGVPPPPRKETPDELLRESRRQGTFGHPLNGYY